MNVRTRLISAVTLSIAMIGALGSGAVAQKDKREAAGAKVGQTAPTWTATDIKGKEWKSSDHAGKIVVLEWVNPQCPVCREAHKDGRIGNMVKELKELGAVHIAVNSSHFTNAEENDKALKGYGVQYPVLLDTEGTIGRAFGAKTTPHIFVIDGEGVLRYNGALDNNPRGDKKSGEVTNYAINAVRQIKAGETVSPDQTQPYGCSVKYKAQGRDGKDKDKDKAQSGGAGRMN